MKFFRDNKGFTMAELLIVMAIVVVLASIAIPTFGKQIETARETTDAEAIRAAFEDVYTQAYVDYTTTGKFTNHATTKAAGLTTDFAYTITATTGETLGVENVYVTPIIKLTQKGARFQYVKPSFKLGAGNNFDAVELKEKTTDGTNASTHKTNAFMAYDTTKQSYQPAASSVTVAFAGNDILTETATKKVLQTQCQVAFVFQPDNTAAEGTIKLVEAFIIATGPAEPTT